MAHITRSGNKYSDKEWEEKQQEFATQKANVEAVEKMRNYMRRIFRENGLDESLVGLARLGGAAA